MADIQVNPELVYQAYDQKLSAANKENAILQAAISQLQGEVTQLKTENQRLSNNQTGGHEEPETSLVKP